MMMMMMMILSASVKRVHAQLPTKTDPDHASSFRGRADMQMISQGNPRLWQYICDRPFHVIWTKMAAHA